MCSLSWGCGFCWFVDLVMVCLCASFLFGVVDFCLFDKVFCWLVLCLYKYTTIITIKQPPLNSGELYYLNISVVLMGVLRIIATEIHALNVFTKRPSALA